MFNNTIINVQSMTIYYKFAVYMMKNELDCERN